MLLIEQVKRKWLQKDAGGNGFDQFLKKKKNPQQISSNVSPSRGAGTILVPRKLILVFFFVLFTKFLAFAAPFFLIPVSLIFPP